MYNFVISYPILLKLFLTGLSDLSDLSGSIESKLFLEWTWALNKEYLNEIIYMNHILKNSINL